jgi:SLOG cluster2
MNAANNAPVSRARIQPHPGRLVLELNEMKPTREQLQWVPNPPELLTAPDATRSGAALHVYPDPPLGVVELAPLKRNYPELRLTTPTMLPLVAAQARASAPAPAVTEYRKPLQGVVVGLLVSHSPDLAMLGLGPRHLEDAYVELSRHLLARGATMAYGGDHRRRGFTEIMFELASSYDLPDKLPPDRIRNCLAWPYYLELTDDDRARLKPVATLVEVPPPNGVVPDAKEKLPRDTPANRSVLARCLTHMRERMTAEVDAWVFLGGQVTGFHGCYPGIAEEAHLAVKAGKPVFILGGFGGCARDVSEAISDQSPVRLTEQFQNKDSAYAQTIQAHNQKWAQTPIAYNSLLQGFREAGVAGLKNGLDERENLQLFESDDLDLLVALVVKGLMKVKGNLSGR